MKRIAFHTRLDFLDAGSKAVLREEMIHLAEEDTHLEFWFDGRLKNNDFFSTTAVRFIQELRSVLPANKIEIVVCVDQAWAETERMWDEEAGCCYYLPCHNVDETRIRNLEEAAKRSFPAGAEPRIEYFPHVEIKVDSSLTTLRLRNFKLRRWMWEQCDKLLVYHYKNLYTSAHIDIQRLQKSDKLEIKSIFDPQVYDRIDQLIEENEGRTRTILRELGKGKSTGALPHEWGITPSRIQQIAEKAEERIKSKIRIEFCKGTSLGR